MDRRIDAPNERPSGRVRGANPANALNVQSWITCSSRRVVHAGVSIWLSCNLSFSRYQTFHLAEPLSANWLAPFKLNSCSLIMNMVGTGHARDLEVARKLYEEKIAQHLREDR